MKRIVLVAGCWWLALLGMYLLLAGSVGAAEVIAGCGVALVATAALTVVRLYAGVWYEMKAGWWKPLASLPRRALEDCAVVFRAILQQPFRTRTSGRFSEREFNPGNDQVLSKTRRALVLAAVSVAPNSIAITIDRERRRLIVHELLPATQPHRDPDWPL